MQNGVSFHGRRFAFSAADQNGASSASLKRLPMLSISAPPFPVFGNSRRAVHKPRTIKPSISTIGKNSAPLDSGRVGKGKFSTLRQFPKA